MAESGKARAAYDLYEAMGPGRTLGKLAYEMGHPASYLSQLGRWSSQHDWQHRVAEYDHAGLREALGKRKIVRETTLQKMVDGMDQAAEVLLEIMGDSGEIPIMDRQGNIAGYKPRVKASTRLEAAKTLLGITGLVPVKRLEVVDTSGEALDEAADLARSLSDDQLSAMIKILKTDG